MFNVLRWEIPNTVKYLPPDGIKVFNFEKRDIVIVWFKKYILLYENVNLCELQNGDVSPENAIVLSVEGTIVNILQLGDVIGVYNGCTLYLLVKASAGHSPPVTLKMHMKMHQEVLTLGTLSQGFVLLKKRSSNLFVDVYSSGPRMVPVEKKFSVKLPEAAYQDVSCTLTSLQCADLDPVLASLLLEDLALVSSQVIFVALESGQAYCIPVSVGGGSTPKPVPKLLYSAAQPVAGIVCLKDPVTDLYSHVGVVLRSGLTVCITSNQQKLRYHMVYLPGAVESCYAVKDSIVTVDGVDVWHSKLSWSNEGLPTVQKRTVGVKGVCALDLVPGSNFILAITLHLTLYCLELGSETSSCQPKNFNIPPHILDNVENQTQRLNELKLQIIQEEKILEAISIFRRDEFLQNTFNISVQVHFSEKDGIIAHVFEMQLKNTQDQDYCSDTWSLHVSLRAENVNVMETVKLERRIRRGVTINTVVTASIPEPLFCVEVSCYMVAKLSEDVKVEGTPWAIIPIAATTLDVSYFFTSSAWSNASSISENLLRITNGHMGDSTKKLDFEQEKMSYEQECSYVFRLVGKWSTPSDVWSAVVENSGHRFTVVPTEKELLVYVGCHLVKMSLNANCNIIQLQCKDVRLLHHVKRCLAQLLEKASNSVQSVSINWSILSKAQKLKSEVQLEGADLNLLREDWRNSVAKHLPLV